MFEEFAKGIPKAEALRRSTLALMGRTDNPYFAHPALWAPFVGEGNVEWAGREREWAASNPQWQTKEEVNIKNKTE